MPKYAIFGYYGQGNAGDEAILAALIAGIKANIPGAVTSVYSANPIETERTHGTKSFSFFPSNVIGSIVASIGRNRAKFYKSLRNFICSDVIVIGGGGLLFDTPETNKWMMGYLHLIRYAKFFKKKVVLVGVSIGPLYHQSSRQEIGKALRTVDLISVRDQASRELLLSCEVPKELIQVVPDLVFTLKPADPIRVDYILRQEKIEKSIRPVIVFTPCSYNSHDPFWVDQYANLCVYAVESLNMDIWFIPMQQSSNHSDKSAIEKICAGLGSRILAQVKILKGQYLPSEVQGLIKAADFVLAERLHGTIMALNSQTPFMSIGYMPKVIQVLKDIEREDLLISMEDFLSSTYLKRLTEKLVESVSEKNALVDISNSVQQAAHKNFALLNGISAR